jgi:hypothetical protein
MDSTQMVVAIGLRSIPGGRLVYTFQLAEGIIHISQCKGINP